MSTFYTVLRVKPCEECCIAFTESVYICNFFHLFWWDNQQHLGFLLMNEWTLSLLCFHFYGAESKCLHGQPHVCSGLVGRDPVYQLPVMGGWKLMPRKASLGALVKPYREEYLQDNTAQSAPLDKDFLKVKWHVYYVCFLYSLWNHSVDCGLIQMSSLFI